MRLIFYILFLLFIIQGCIVKKNTVEKDTVKKETEDLPESKIDTLDIYNQRLLPISSSPLFYDKIESIKILEKNRYTEKVLNKYNIKNYIDTTTVVNYDMGIIGYNIPSNFKVNEWSTIKLRISRKNKIESIILGSGSRPISLVDINSKDDIILDRIRIDDTMSAKLYSDDSVEIRFVTREEQRLSEDSYTEWVWRVKPKTSKPCYLKMIITMSKVDYVVYEEEILVEPNWLWSFSNWFSKWWQAITATIITPILIPLIIWLRNRRKSKKSD
jgi:hypothetical protein